MKNKIFVVEDDESISKLIYINLIAAGYEVETAYDGEEALEKIKNSKPFDLALLDIMLPKKDGFELLPEFVSRSIPVIFLTAKNDVFSKVEGLKNGAEDYIVKPFEILELLVRIEKVLQRYDKLGQEITVGDICIDLTQRTVKKDGQIIELKPMEFDLLVVLSRNKNIALSREQLLQMVWGDDFLGETRTVDVHIGQLRKKLDCHDMIKTVSKIGYRLEAE
ncbi:phosphate regulon transcriptional regulatory protein PhoB [Lachnospiraceae bacterium KM106-2]|nr:phosphate regulon transcriptional regulatory protein PhoB [Lachnospiraceae bacterium KM106-2]